MNYDRTSTSLFTGVRRSEILRSWSSALRSSTKFARGELEPTAADAGGEANALAAGPTRPPGGCGTRPPGAACAADRWPDPAHRCARAFQAAPPCGRGTALRPGTYPPGRASASSRNPPSVASSYSWSIGGVMVPRGAYPNCRFEVFCELLLYGVLGSSLNSELRTTTAPGVFAEFLAADT